MTAKEIENDVKIKIEKALKNAARDITSDLEKAYESAVDAFYASYSPVYYHRDYNTYLASDTWNDYDCEKNLQWEKSNGNIIGFKTGIKVSSNYITGSAGSPYKDPTDYVFERTYYYGIHGTIKTGGIMLMPPERLMQLSYEGIKKNLGKYVNKYL